MPNDQLSMQIKTIDSTNDCLFSFSFSYFDQTVDVRSLTNSQLGWNGRRVAWVCAQM
ncbi:hypothetical protein BGW36DRAFT_382044 [Talaromyces proteolyticus]|uniref:Uncharacterized protein n=1 Tax=Talaromyces proteolyticus TaxID=1131652 RepID=A0AAD4PWG5_9EURO|nr:uncharacterized protein BGW36DRAFT_382044 [Talaromyces proteolyticus]KAH8695065.1 hypothetical protein BGW36DRAFT_382044 [Talaromyces proteolyticus]